MKNKAFLLLAILSSHFLAFAQTDFRPGYIITNSNDTISGEIDYRGDLLMAQRCTFKSSEEIKTEYTPFDISAYRFTNGKYYVSRDLNGRSAFLEYLIKGKVNVYYQRDQEGDHYYMDKEGVKLAEIPYKEEIRYKEGENHFDHSVYYLYQSIVHKNFLALYLQDAPKLEPRIYNLEKPEHQNMIRLAKDYHNIVCKDETCIIYDKKPPFLGIALEPAGGLVNYSNQEDLKDKNYFQFGVFMHLWMPRTNEKLFFRTGLLYSTLEYEAKVRLWKIPIQLEYISPKGKVRPKAAFGINLYKPMHQSVALMVGMNMKLSKSIFWSIDYDIDFTPTSQFPFIPDKLLSNNLSTGIYFKL
jgi:hypothetical protein